MGLCLLLTALAANSGCALASLGMSLGIGGHAASGNVQASSRAPEELYLGDGEGPYLYRLAEDMLYQGRYREAVNAYMKCEMGAYTNALREAARTRRLWLQEVILACENGTISPPPPVITRNPQGAAWVPPKPIYEQPAFPGNSSQDMSVVVVNPNRLDPRRHYEADEAEYYIYGYGSYPGDITPEQIQVPPPSSSAPE
jgi:hypothetical protein